MDQVSLINKLIECLDHPKVIKLQIEWLDGKKEDILFEPYLIGENPTSKWTFIYGRISEKNQLSYIPVQYIDSFEETGDGFSVKEKNKIFFVHYFENNKVIKKIPEIDVNIHFDVEQTILYNQAKFRILTYDDEEHCKDFIRVKRKKWEEIYFELIAEWSQSPMHSGDLNFIVKSTKDKKYWALFMKGRPTRIYAVAEMIKGGEIVMEYVAAEMMSAYTCNEGIVIDVLNCFGEVDYELLMTFYGSYYRSREVES